MKKQIGWIINKIKEYLTCFFVSLDIWILKKLIGTDVSIYLLKNDKEIRSVCFKTHLYFLLSVIFIVSILIYEIT